MEYPIDELWWPPVQPNDAARVPRVNLADYIRDDPRSGNQSDDWGFIFNEKEYANCDRATQEKLVSHVQSCCLEQGFTMTVHTWANKEERGTLRIRLKCSHNRRTQCKFSFQLCYGLTEGFWYLRRGSGKHIHSGHLLENPKISQSAIGAVVPAKSEGIETSGAVGEDERKVTPVGNGGSSATGKRVLQSSGPPVHLDWPKKQRQDDLAYPTTQYPSPMIDLQMRNYCVNVDVIRAPPNDRYPPVVSDVTSFLREPTESRRDSLNRLEEHMVQLGSEPTLAGLRAHSLDEREVAESMIAGARSSSLSPPPPPPPHSASTTPSNLQKTLSDSEERRRKFLNSSLGYSGNSYAPHVSYYPDRELPTHRADLESPRRLPLHPGVHYANTRREQYLANERDEHRSLPPPPPRYPSNNREQLAGLTFAQPLTLEASIKSDRLEQDRHLLGRGGLPQDDRPPTSETKKDDFSSIALSSSVSLNEVLSDLLASTTSLPPEHLPETPGPNQQDPETFPRYVVPGVPGVPGHALFSQTQQRDQSAYATLSEYPSVPRSSSYPEARGGDRSEDYSGGVSVLAERVPEAQYTPVTSRASLEAERGDRRPVHGDVCQEIGFVSTQWNGHRESRRDDHRSENGCLSKGPYYSYYSGGGLLDTRGNDRRSEGGNVLSEHAGANEYVPAAAPVNLEASDSRQINESGPRMRRGEPYYSSINTRGHLETRVDEQQLDHERFLGHRSEERLQEASVRVPMEARGVRQLSGLRNQSEFAACARQEQYSSVPRSGSFQTTRDYGQRESGYVLAALRDRDYLEANNRDERRSEGGHLADLTGGPKYAVTVAGGNFEARREVRLPEDGGYLKDNNQDNNREPQYCAAVPRDRLEARRDVDQSERSHFVPEHITQPQDSSKARNVPAEHSWGNQQPGKESILEERARGSQYASSLPQGSPERRDNRQSGPLADHTLPPVLKFKEKDSQSFMKSIDTFAFSSAGSIPLNDSEEDDSKLEGFGRETPPKNDEEIRDDRKLESV